MWATRPHSRHPHFLFTFSPLHSTVTSFTWGITVRKLLQGALFFAFLLTSLSSRASDKHRKDVPEAPLPASVVSAKKIFLTNGGGSALAFDEFYSKMKEWGRFEIVGSPSTADIVVDLRYFVEDDGTRVSSYTNTYTGQTQVVSHRVVDPQLSVNIYDAKTKDLLWSVTDHRRLARREKNREKETINSADRLIDGMKERIAAPTSTSTTQQP
jgi:hypothetical protein